MNFALRSSASAAGTLTGQMSNFVAGLDYDSLPEDVQRLAHLVLLDALGCALAGSITPELTAIRRSVRELNDGGGTSAVWGTAEKASPAYAALANGAAVHVREIDDFGGCAHSGSVVIPAALGVAERVGASGKQLLASIVAGYDIAHRVMDGGGGYLAFKKRGWHSTSTCGGFGAAAAAGYLLNLDAERLQWALGYAGSNAGGTWAFIPDGAMNKRLHPGFAAQTGVVSAYLARNGATAPTTILEEEWGGYYTTYVPGLATPEKSVAGLGSDYRIRLVGFKPYAACRGIHSSIEVMLRLRETHGVKAKDIDHIVVRGSQTHKRQLGRQDVRTTLDAQMSLPYSVAVAAVSGRASLDEFTQAALERPDVLVMAGRVDVTLDNSVADGAEPWIDVHLVDGSVLTDRIPVARGDHANPLSEEELLEKFRVSAGLLLHADQVAVLERKIMNCAGLSDVSTLIPLLEPQSGQRSLAQTL